MNRILIVDDEKKNLKAVKRILAGHNYTIEFAQNGPEALARIDSFGPDLVLLDIMMPGMNGYEVCHCLKSNDKTSDVMVLLLSGKGMLEDRLKGYDVDADDYIVKPYDPEELKAKVRILLRLKNAQDELKEVNHNLEKLVEAKTRALVKKERQALVGQMAQGLIHNLKGPVTVIHARAEIISRIAGDLLKNTTGSSGVFIDMVKKIIHQADYSLGAVDKLETLIHNLLIKSRQDAEDDRQKIDLNELITKELEFLDSDTKLRQRIKRTLDLDASLPVISGVYSDFSQIIYNMVSNASEAMENSPKKEMVISTKHDAGDIRIEFKDTGSGIAPENMDRIFTPFFTTKKKGGAKDKGRPEGIGLGLHTCSQLIKTYGGGISVKSKPGKGTTFVISIPVMD